MSQYVKLFASRLGAITYLLKYICKRAHTMIIQFQWMTAGLEKINDWLESKYISASGAAWRISCFEYVDRQPFIVFLYVHFDGHHTVYYGERNLRTTAGRKKPKP